ncbi:MAG: flavin reductase family protein [Acidobacteria bacterium]|nr:flavin reductase family protein [Acidobacteriota bacterium]
MTVHPSEQNPRDIYKLMIGSIVPRPIAFVSTVSPEGARNLAPFSFFNGVCPNPPVVCFCASFRQGPDGALAKKDTLRNVQQTGEFVVNIVSEDFAEAMNLASGDYAPDVDEFVVAGLTPLASVLVKPPRVQQARVQMECRLIQVVTVSERPLGGSVVLGEVVLFHIDDAVVDNFRIDPDKLRAIGRMGGNTYARTTDRFDLARPVVK